LLGFYFGGQPYRGSQRAYWIEYPNVTKFAVGASVDLLQGRTVFLRVENVADTRRFERHNLNIPMPRTFIVGATVKY